MSNSRKEFKSNLKYSDLLGLIDANMSNLSFDELCQLSDKIEFEIWDRGLQESENAFDADIEFNVKDDNEESDC